MNTRRGARTPSGVLHAVLNALRAGCLSALMWGLTACSAPPAAPPSLYRLPLELGDAAGSATPSDQRTSPAPVWQLMPVALPELLDRDSLLLPQAGTGVLRASGHRWAEPLHEAVPRLLQHDLALLRGAATVFSSPLPPGLVVARQLRLQVLVFEAAPDRRSVLLQARWTLAAPLGTLPPEVGQARIQVASSSDQPAALVAAHRLALWQLARQMSGQAPAAL